MAVRTKDLRYSPGVGYLKYGNPRIEVPVQPNGGFDFLLGSKQTIDSPYPKGSKAFLVCEPITKAYYLPLKPVRIEKSELLATPLSFVFDYAAGGYRVYYYSPVGNASLAWYMEERAALSLGTPSQASKDKALTMALSRVADSPFMGAVDLGEIHETLNFMRKPFGGLRDALRGFHRKTEDRLAAKRKTAPRGKNPNRPPVDRTGFKTDRNKWRTDIAADTWLEYRYAVGPLIYSAQDLAETCATSVTNLVQKVHSARGANKVVSSSDGVEYPGWLYDGTNVGFRRSARYFRSYEVKAAYVVRYIYYPWMVDAINLARFGISPTQLLSSSYELLKFSFVGEWFVNIGQWLKAMEPKPQVKIIDVCYTEKCHNQISVVDTGGTWAYPGDLPPAKNCISSYKRTAISRTVVTDNLQAPTPRVNAEWQTVKRTIDSLSLLWRPGADILRRYKPLIGGRLK